MKTIPRLLSDRTEQAACDKAADLLWNESMDDYAAAVITIQSDGSAHVSVACEMNTWLALCLACNRDVARAGALAEMHTPDEWSVVDCNIYGRVQMRPISNDAGEVVAYLFKR